MVIKITNICKECDYYLEVEEFKKFIHSFMNIIDNFDVFNEEKKYRIDFKSKLIKKYQEKFTIK